MVPEIIIRSLNSVYTYFEKGCGREIDRRMVIFLTMTGQMSNGNER